MTAKKKPAKKPAKPAKDGVGTATLDPKEGKVIELPKGMGRAKDGTITLKAGLYENLDVATYELHAGARMKLEGRVFVADYNVNWIPVKACVCKVLRKESIVIRKLKTGHFAQSGTCANKKCQYRDTMYLWIHPENRFIL